MKNVLIGMIVFGIMGAIGFSQARASDVTPEVYQFFREQLVQKTTIFSIDDDTYDESCAGLSDNQILDIVYPRYLMIVDKFLEERRKYVSHPGILHLSDYLAVSSAGGHKLDCAPLDDEELDAYLNLARVSYLWAHTIATSN